MSRIGRMAAATRPASRVRSVRPAIARRAAPVRAAVRGESRRRRLTWLAIASLLVLGPLAFNLARQSNFEASMTIFPQAVGPYPPIDDPGYYRSLLADRELREQTKLHAGDAVGDEGDVAFRRGPRPGTVTLTTRAESPDSAKKFLGALGPQIANATNRQLAVVVDRDAQGARERLAGAGLPGDTRRALKRRLRRLEKLGEAPPARVALGDLPTVPPMERWADRLADDLPGDFPARQNPAWAALAGLFVAATLWAIWRVLFPPAA